jgi:chaperonin GroES
MPTNDTLAFFLCKNYRIFRHIENMSVSFLWHNFCQIETRNLILITNTKYMGLNIQPLADRVLVEPAAAETTTASGIIIPDTAKEKPQKGTVVAVGNGKKDEPLTVKVGDTVLYGKYSGTELKFEGTDYLIMRESDILAII